MASVIPFGVGMPAWLILNEFGMLLRDDFDEVALLVGSALNGKGPRDIDVRIVLDDDVFATRYPDGFGKPGTRWAAQCRAYSALGQHMTGLAIDFQVQPRFVAATHEEESRLPLLIIRDQT